MYVQVSNLPSILQNALRSVGYGKSDINVVEKTTTSLQMGGGDGWCAFVIIVNAETGEANQFNGSWGGANMFNLDNMVDTDDSVYELTTHTAIISGQTGGRDGATYASIAVSPNSALVSLQSSQDDLSKVERQVLVALRSLIGKYRKEAIAGQESTVESLVQRGYIKRAKNGALSLTLSGKNASLVGDSLAKYL
jgi:hypothetical protein